MSETLRDLVVSLSLQTDNFTRNINSVNKQIREAESAFKLAAAGVENFEKTTSGLAAKQTTLTRQLNLQKTAVEQYQKALEAAKNHLKECQANQAAFEQKLADAKGANTSASELKKLAGQVEATRKATQNAADTVSVAATKLNNAEAAVRSMEKSLQQCGTQLTAAQNGFYDAGVVIASSENTVASLGKQMQLAQSKFQLAGAGISNFGETVSGAAAKLNLLKENHTLLLQQVQALKDAVQAAETQVKAAEASGDTERIREAKDRLVELKTSLNNTEAAVRSTKEAIRQCDSQLTAAQNGFYDAGVVIASSENTVASLGKQMQLAQSKFQLAGAGISNFGETASGAAAKLNLLKENQKLLLQQVQALKDAVQAAETQVKAAEASGNADKIREAKDRLVELKTSLNNTEAAVKNTQSAMDNCKASIAAMTSDWTRSAQVLERNQNTLSMLGLRMQTVQSSFTLASAGVKNVAENATVLEAKLETLSTELNIQQATIRKYEESLAAAKTQLIAAQRENNPEKIRQARTAVEENTAALNNARAAYANTKQAIQETNNALTLAQNGYYTARDAIKTNEKAVASLGKQMQLAESKFRLAGAGIDNFGRKSSGAAAKLDLLKDKQKILRQQVDQLRDAVKNAQTQLEAANASGDSEKIREAKDKLTELNTTLNNTEAELRAVTHELNRQSSVWTRAGNSLVNFSSGVKKVSGGLNSFGRTMTRSVTTPLVTLGTAAVKASIDFEDSFASVRKTVETTEKQFEELAAASKQMSTEVAASTSEINAVMATGGQLGVSADSLAEFTRVMIDLGNSCEDLSATDAATMLAKFANIMDSGEKQYKNMGSTLVALGNNFATTEGDIMELAMRLAGAGKQVGLSEAQVLGFATALSSVGINAEAGGSAFSKALVQMEVAAATGGQALDDFAKVSGMTADEFKTLWDSNPAAAFQAFIEGLAQLDDEGESAIVVLNEIGISEVRLRDTMLRSVNATELFARALGLADEAWDENNALTEEANKRYATTASKLTNLKNKAVLVAQQLGDDMNPTIQNLIGSVSDLLDKFMGLDEQQRMSIVKWGAVAASIGPAVLVMGKVTGVVGSVTGAVGKGMQAIGKFSGAVKDAGGGMTGLVKVVGSSPGKMAALTVAVIAVAAAIYDVASGAKAAREALEGMNKTANEWKNTAAETFYGSGEGLGFFDMSADDFVASTKQTAKVTTTAVQDWMDGMIAVWSDGKYETDAIVKEWQDSSSEVSKETLEHMKELRTQAQESGDTAKAQELDADIAALEALDKRISDNLRFFQGKKLTDANKAFWQGLMNEKQEILLKWGFAEEPIGGNEAYEAIANKVRAAEARAAAMEQEVDSSLYEEATLATAQGYAAILQQINDEYDAEYAKIQQITDASERQARQNALDEDYTKKRADAAKEYGAATQEYMAKVLNSDGVENTKDQLTKLKDLLSDLAELSPTDTQGRANILSQLNELTEGMDEGALTEYLTMLTQVGSQIALLESSGMDDADIQALFPSIELDDIKKALALYSEIGEYLYKFRNEDEISPLNTMLNEAIPEEVLTITADLNLDGAKASWEAFAANPGSPITTDVQVRPSLRGTISLTGYDYMAYKGFANKNEELEIDGRIRLGNVTEAQWETALGEGRVKYYKDGVEVDANVALASDIDENTLALITRDEDGTITYNVLIATQVTGDKEAIDAVSALVDEEEKIAPTLLGQAAGIMPTTLMGLITSATERIQSYQKTKDWSGWDKFWANLLYGESTDLGVLNTSMELDFSQDSVAELSAYIGEMVAAIQQGKAVSEDDLNNLKLIFEFLNGLQDTGTGTHILTGAAEGVTAGGITSTVDTVVENLGAAIQTAESQINGVGEDIAAGIGEGQANYDFANDAETTISNDEAALRTAADSHSPAVRMKPLGADIAAGIGEGMTGYDFSAYASSTVGSLQSAMSAALLSGSLRSVGVNAMYGMAAGIRAGRANVISAMRSAAQAAVSAAKTALQIHSPSRVFRDEVGAMTMKGFGEGVLDETREQAKVISNAARYLTHAAGSSALAATNDNRKTYNNDNSTSFSFAGATFSVRSDQDVHDLAVEIATLTRRNQRGRGYRMA